MSHRKSTTATGGYSVTVGHGGRGYVRLTATRTDGKKTLLIPRALAFEVADLIVGEQERFEGRR